MANFTSNSPMVLALMREIRKYPVLTTEQEVDAFLAYKNGDESQRERILNSNLRFVFSFAKDIAGGDASGERVMDTFQNLMEHYIRAFEKFDVTMGFKFCSFAVTYMKNALREMYANESMVKKTNWHIFKNMPNKVREEFLMANEREATDEEVVEILESRGYKVRNKADIAKGGVASINDSASADDDACEAHETGELALRMSDSNEYLSKIDKEDNEHMVAVFLSVLPPKERKAVELVVIKGMLPEEVGEIMGVCRERVRQLVNGGIKRMKTKARNMGYKVA